MNDDMRRDDPEEIPEEGGDLPIQEVESDLDDDGRYRTIGIGIVLLMAAVIIGFMAAGSMMDQTVAAVPEAKSKGAGIPYPNLVLAHMPLVDTVYTTDSLYLDVNLARQDVTVRFRNGTSRRFLISSGNPAISEGMSTPAGLYTVQNMVPMAISKQFNNARLHHWIGVQGGVGFHGLDGSGYYGYLGKRPSSHGCIRMSREEIAQMYRLVHPGAIILVHYGSAARTVAFCTPEDTAGAVLVDSTTVYNKQLGHERLASLMEGKYWIAPQPRIVHLAGQRLRWGLTIGDAKKIPKQEIPEVRLVAGFEKYVPTARVDRSLVRRDHDLALLKTMADSDVGYQRRQDSANGADVVYGK